MDPAQMFREIGFLALLSLVVAAVPLVAAAIYAARPSESKLSLMRPLSLASLFAGLLGIFTGFVNILQGIAATDDMTGRWSRVAAGASEALVPVVFTFACLTLAWLLIAIGMWRGSREE